MGELSLSELGRTLATLFAAFLLALPIGWDRERRHRGAGIRTFPLVSMASCAYVLMASQVLHSPESTARVIYGVITGIGFIGGGAIIREGASVTGTATAASIWNTGAIGVAIALSRYDIGLMLAVLNFAILRYVARFKHHWGEHEGP
jgi:putative Mg2+ transporter-C (MgtC) family protein